MFSAGLNFFISSFDNPELFSQMPQMKAKEITATGNTIH